MAVVAGAGGVGGAGVVAGAAVGVGAVGVGAVGVGAARCAGVGKAVVAVPPLGQKRSSVTALREQALQKKEVGVQQ